MSDKIRFDPAQFHIDLPKFEINLDDFNFEVPDGFDKSRLSSLKPETIIGTIKRAWNESRDEMESNGKTVRENEAEAKAEVIASVKSYLKGPKGWVNLTTFAANAYWVNSSMASKGHGAHWYSPKRLFWQVIVNELRLIALDPDQYVETMKSAAKYGLAKSLRDK